MSAKILEKIYQEKDYYFKKDLFKIISEYELTLNETLLLIYFINQTNPVFDVNLIKEEVFLDHNEILEAFTLLTSKNLVNTIVSKDQLGRINEKLSLDCLYQKMVNNLSGTCKKELEDNIFELFEKEFGRTLTPSELEIINAWLKSGTKEELIIGALKEASYNGVSNLRYIDKILYEWGKKGFKSLDEVNKHLKSSAPTEEKKELFEYNWLEDDD